VVFQFIVVQNLKQFETSPEWHLRSPPGASNLKYDKYIDFDSEAPEVLKKRYYLNVRFLGEF